MRYVTFICLITFAFNVSANLSDKEFQYAQKMYDTYCLSCHGVDLDGNGEVAELLEPYPRNFTKYQFVIAYKDRFKNSLLVDLCKDWIKNFSLLFFFNFIFISNCS